jgi:hypothetical protein
MSRQTLLSRWERWERWLYLAIALVPLLGSILLNHGLSLALPGCPLMEWIGVPCPGWGLTRSFLAMAQGDWQRAIAFHAFGPIIALGCCWALVHVSLELIRDRKIPLFLGVYLRQPRVQIACFLVLLGYHGTRLYALWQSEELWISVTHSPVRQWWGV